MKHLHTFFQHLYENITQEVLEFCEKHDITQDQFRGNVKIENNLNLDSLKSIPQGFNPNVAGNLGLYSLETVPQDFSPTVSGNLEIGAKKILPGFAPTVGRSLYLEYIDAIPIGFSPRIEGDLWISGVSDLRSPDEVGSDAWNWTLNVKGDMLVKYRGRMTKLSEIKPEGWIKIR